MTTEENPTPKTFALFHDAVAFEDRYKVNHPPGDIYASYEEAIKAAADRSWTPGVDVLIYEYTPKRQSTEAPTLGFHISHREWRSAHSVPQIMIGEYYPDGSISAGEFSITWDGPDNCARVEIFPDALLFFLDNDGKLSLVFASLDLNDGDWIAAVAKLEEAGFVDLTSYGMSGPPANDKTGMEICCPICTENRIDMLMPPEHDNACECLRCGHEFTIG